MKTSYANGQLMSVKTPLRVTQIAAAVMGVGLVLVTANEAGISETPQPPGTQKFAQPAAKTAPPVTIVNRLLCDNVTDRFGVYIDRSQGPDELLLYTGNMQDMFAASTIADMPKGKPVGSVSQSQMTFDQAIEVLASFCGSGKVPATKQPVEERHAKGETMLAMNIDL
jgi:hypothetical protein